MNKKKSKIVSTKYFINPYSKVVVCVLHCHLQMPKDPLWIPLGDIPWKRTLPQVTSTGIFTVRGVARCSPEDKFNEKLGMKIAESRAKIKAFRTASKVYSSIHSHLILHVSEAYSKELLWRDRALEEENNLKIHLGHDNLS